MDYGLYDGNYWDYENDEIAIQRESDISQEIPPGMKWEDPAFPPDGRSLYFDPLCPPKGSLPADSLTWLRISDGDIEGCLAPVTYAANRQSSLIVQGALGNSYFTNALRVMACDAKAMNRVLVSSRFAPVGLYTFKIAKAGKWRYVHVDDRIPCRQSGRVHFCRNFNPNETFAMLLEKAYAKLHGSYESLLHGQMEKVLQELTPAAHVKVLRSDHIPDEELYDVTWRCLEHAVEEQRLIACRRVSADPYSDGSTDRQGIVLGMPYQVVDLCVAHADATEFKDSLDVGLVCVRNLQIQGGRFTGRWAYGHSIWLEYPQIAEDLAARTTALVMSNPSYGELPPTKGSVRSEDVAEGGEDEIGGEDPFAFDDDGGAASEDEIDNFAVNKFSQSRIKAPQPAIEGLYWMQIEDFVELFNRVYVVEDYSWLKNCGYKRYCSRWIPGDFIAGSGGRPVEIEEQPPRVVPDDEADHEEDEEDFADDPFTDNPMYPFVVSEPTDLCIALFQPDRRWTVSRLGTNPSGVTTAQFAVRDSRSGACMHYPQGIGFVVLKLSGLKMRVTTFKMKKIIANSEYIQYSNVCSNVVKLMPGRYALVPFTDSILDFSLDYIVCCHFKGGVIDFEINDIIKERPMDEAASDDEGGGGGLPELTDFQDGEAGEYTMSVAGRGKCPDILPVADWEWREESEELGSLAVYEQVSDLAALLRGLQKKVFKLQEHRKRLVEAEKEKAEQAAAAAKANPKSMARMNTTAY